MFAANSPKTSRVVSGGLKRTLMGDIQSTCNSVNILRLAEKNQQDYSDKIIVLHSSAEVDKSLHVNNTEMIFYDDLASFVDRVVITDLYPHGDLPVFDDERLDIMFTHKTPRLTLYSNYMLFSEDYYAKVKQVLQEIVG